MLRTSRTRAIMSAALAATLAPGVAGAVFGQMDTAAPEQQQQSQQQPTEQQQQQQPTELRQPMAGQRQAKAQPGEGLLRASSLVDHAVRDAQGQQIGQIEEIAIDVTNGRIGYGVVSFADQANLGDELYAIPWSKFKVAPDGQSVTLSMTPQELQNIQGFSEDEWPQMDDPTWAQRTYQQFGEQPYWQQQQQPRQAPMQGQDQPDAAQQEPMQGQMRQQSQMHQMQQQSQQTQQLEQPITQAFQQAGVEQSQAQQHAQRLAQQLQLRSQQGQLSQDQLEQFIGRAMMQAGVEADQARQQAQQLAPQLHQQLQQAQAGGAGQAIDQQPQWVERLSELEDLDVANAEGEELGDIEDFVIDTREGRIAYAVLSYGGFAGLGEDFVAVPWRALSVLPEEETFVLSTDQATLDRLSFEEGQWPNMSDQQWASRVHSEFNQQPYWQVYGYGAAAPGGQPDAARQARIQAQLQQVMVQAGVEPQQAQQQAQQLAEQLTQQSQISQQQLEQQISQSLQQAGVEAEQARQHAQQLAPQLHQQLQQPSSPGQGSAQPGQSGSSGQSTTPSQGSQQPQQSR